ncbi:MAG: hypothetical protein HPY54_01790 [Chthonomonadetes bacterium]|nr:hypothetical protein [Chthonomonadetes bacterium]
MRASPSLLNTLREAPADAVSTHERLLRRAGFMRKEAGGVYTFLPLGARVLRRMVHLLEQAFEGAGFEQVVTPTEEPAQAVLRAVGAVARSWRALPLRWYAWNRYRDEQMEPRGGLLETRERLLLQVWAFTADEESAAEAEILVRDTLVHACRQMGLEVLAGEGDGWQIVGVVQDGEDRLLRCSQCGRAFLPEWCPLPVPSESSASCDGVPPAEVVQTPNLRTVEEVAPFLNVPPSALVKTLLVEADGRAVAVLVRGDHELSLPKVGRVLGAETVQMLSAEQVEAISRAPVGFAGPVGLEGVPLIADWAVRQMQGFVVGANLADAHRVHVCWGRDFAEPSWADVRVGGEGDACVHCGGSLEEKTGTSIGWVGCPKEAHDLTYDDADGVQRAIQVTFGELNLMRLLATVVEARADTDGLVWHRQIAPFEAVILLLNPSDEASQQVAESIYATLRERGVDVLFDDRDERAGAKFKDADLIGVPVQVVVGRSASEGVVEVRLRRDHAPHRVAMEDVAIVVEELLYRGSQEQ